MRPPKIAMEDGQTLLICHRTKLTRKIAMEAGQLICRRAKVTRKIAMEDGQTQPICRRAKLTRM